MNITYVNEITLSTKFKSGIDFNSDDKNKSSDGMDMTCNLTYNLNFLNETSTSVESAQLQNFAQVKHQEKTGPDRLFKQHIFFQHVYGNRAAG